MSHQVFGAKENIFGFSNLDIKLYYTAGSLHQYYQKTFETQISKTDGGIDPDNIEEKVIAFLNVQFSPWTVPCLI